MQYVYTHTSYREKACQNPNKPNFEAFFFRCARIKDHQIEKKYFEQNKSSAYSLTAKYANCRFVERYRFLPPDSIELLTNPLNIKVIGITNWKGCNSIHNAIYSNVAWRNACRGKYNLQKFT